MALTAARRQQIAWFECLALVPADPVTTIDQLATTVTHIAVALDGRGFKGMSPPADPGVVRDRFTAVRDAADAAIQGGPNKQAPPSVAALWDVDGDRHPLEASTPLPPDLAWIKGDGVTPVGLYKPASDRLAGAARRFALFVPKDGGASMPTAFSSSLTATHASAATTTAAPATGHRMGLTIFLAVASLLLLCWAAGCINWSGRQFAQGIALMRSQNPVALGQIELNRAKDPYWPSMQPSGCFNGLATASTSPAAQPAPSTALSPEQTVDCLHWWSAAMKVAYEDRPSTDAELAFHGKSAPAMSALIQAMNEYTRQSNLVQCHTAAAAAIKAQAALVPCILGSPAPQDEAAAAKLVSDAGDQLQKDKADVEAKAAVVTQGVPQLAQAGKADPQSASSGAEPSWIPRLFGLFVPHGTDPTAKLAQLSLMGPLFLMILAVTLLAVAAGLGAMNEPWGILISGQNRLSLARCQVVAWTLLILPTIAAYACFNAGVSSGVGDNGSALTIFPQVPGAIWAALGLSIGSTLLSPVLLASKQTGVPALQVAKGVQAPTVNDVAGLADAPSNLSSNPSPADASFSDLLLGEEATNDTQVDISRMQMLVITVSLVATYADLIFGQLSGITVDALAQAVYSMKSLLGQLPDAGTTFAAMLAISHATYLAAKASGTSPSTPPPQN